MAFALEQERDFFRMQGVLYAGTEYDLRIAKTPLDARSQSVHLAGSDYRPVSLGLTHAIFQTAYDHRLLYPAEDFRQWAARTLALSFHTASRITYSGDGMEHCLDTGAPETERHSLRLDGRDRPRLNETVASLLCPDPNPVYAWISGEPAYVRANYNPHHATSSCAVTFGPLDGFLLVDLTKHPQTPHPALGVHVEAMRPLPPGSRRSLKEDNGC